MRMPAVVRGGDQWHGPSADVPRPGTVTVVSAPSTALGPSLATGLASRGWQAGLVEDERPPEAAVAGPAVVVIEDDEGRPRVRLPSDVRLGSCVCVGSASSLPVLRRLHRRGATVVDRAAGFLALLAVVELCLHMPDPARRRSQEVAVSLERRHRESAALATLTASETEVLGAMLAGLSAVEIGGLRHVALSTVRSQIRSILAKLGVTSQLSAVAVARRSSARPWPGEEPARFGSLADLGSRESPQIW